MTSDAGDPSEVPVEAADGCRLMFQSSGAGSPVLLLHGLSATRRYVVMGSRTLERSGHRVLAADARGHGASSPAPATDAYDYGTLAADALAILDSAGVERAVLAGSSMGAHTALRVALSAPDRVAGLVLVTPAHRPGDEKDAARLERWDELSAGLRSGGVAGFLAAYGEPDLPGPVKATVLKVLAQRLALHEHPEAVADALRAVPRSRPFERLEELARVTAPVAIIASGDAADPGHPQAVAEEYARIIPGAILVLDEPGRSPRAWQGSQVSRVISDTVERARQASSF